jgi:WD40 repeat protein
MPKQLLQILTIERGNFTSAVFSPDGKNIITVSMDYLREPRDIGSAIFTRINGSLQIWGTDFQFDKELQKESERWEQLQKQRELQEPGDAPFRPDRPNQFFLLGEELLLLTLEGYGGLDVTVSPDGKNIATAGYDGIVRIVNAESGERLRKLEGHIGSIFSVAFSPDGKRIVTGGEDKTIRIWTLE